MITIHCAVSVYLVPRLQLALQRGANVVSVEHYRELVKEGRIDGVRLRLEPGDDCLAMTATEAKAFIAECEDAELCDRIAQEHPRPTVREAAASRRDELLAPPDDDAPEAV